MLKKQLPFLAALTSSTIFSFVFFFIIKASSAIGNDPFRLLAFRLSIAAIIMTLLWKLGVLKMNFRGKKWGILALSGLMSPILNFSIETIGVQTIPTSQFAVMYAASPVFITLWGALFLKEYPKKQQLFYIALSITGVLIINISPDLSMSPMAVLLPFLTMLSGSANSLFIKKASLSGFTHFECLYFTTAESALVFLIISLSQHTLQGSLASYFNGVFTFDFIVSILYLSIGSSIIAFSLAFYNMTRLPLVVTSSFSGLSTAISIAVGVFLMQESFGPRKIFGTALIILGVFLMNASYVKSTQQAPLVEPAPQLPLEEEEDSY